MIWSVAIAWDMLCGQTLFDFALQIDRCSYFRTLAQDKAHAFELRVVHAYNYGTFFKNYTQ